MACDSRCRAEPVFTASSLPNNPPISVVNGELFLLGLYSALRTSGYWEKTLLIIVYDEHGGLYDHVYPPNVPSAASQAILAASSSDFGGFAFNVYGPRVPAIIVSPYVNPGSRLVSTAGGVYDHTSIIRTLWEVFNLDIPPHGAPGINAWDQGAPPILGACATEVVNNPPMWPSL